MLLHKIKITSFTLLVVSFSFLILSLFVFFLWNHKTCDLTELMISEDTKLSLIDNESKKFAFFDLGANNGDSVLKFLNNFDQNGN